jgi:hypothetical protein
MSTRIRNGSAVGQELVIARIEQTSIIYALVVVGGMKNVRPPSGASRNVGKRGSNAVTLNLDGAGKASVRTGVPFFDHMLTLLAKHATMDLKLRCQGDLEVDAHHTVEDCGLVLGQAFLQALGDKKGIRRYGTGFDPRNPFTGEAYVPMDECLARCVVDFSGRPLSGLARLASGGPQEDHGGGEDPGCLVGLPVWPGAGVLPGLCQRSPVQSSPGIALRG